MKKYKKNPLASTIRYIDADTLEVRTHHNNMVVRFMLYCLLTIFVLPSFPFFNKSITNITPFNFLWEDSIEWICCIEEKLNSNFQRYKTLVDPTITFDIYKINYAPRVDRAWGNLLLWSLLLVPFFIREPLGIRYDRRRKVAYAINWRGHFYAAPIYDESITTATYNPFDKPLSPLFYLNPATLISLPLPLINSPFAPCIVHLYRRKANEKLKAMYIYQGMFPPTTYHPPENEQLVKALNAFMQGDDSYLYGVGYKYRWHPSLFGKLINFNPLGRRRYREDKVNAMVDDYIKEWQQKSEAQKAGYIDKVSNGKFDANSYVYQIVFVALLIGAYLCAVIYQLMS